MGPRTHQFDYGVLDELVAEAIKQTCLIEIGPTPWSEQVVKQRVAREEEQFAAVALAVVKSPHEILIIATVRSFMKSIQPISVPS